jgi:FKBP-type peptidyl-prolyl cis-trans isomerase SlyD
VAAKLFFSLLLSAVVLCSWRASTAEAQPQITSDVIIRAGSTVAIEYALYDELGVIIESNRSAEQIRYIHGQGQIISGLERALEGMRVSEQKRVTLKPEEAYGPIKPQAVREVPKEKISAELVKTGARLRAHTEQQSVPVRIHEIKEKTVVVDFNHPLAGKTVIVEVKVLNIISVQTIR